MKKFSVRVFYSGYCTHVVEANDEGDAIEKARLLELDKRATDEILSNLEPWEDADEADEEE